MTGVTDQPLTFGVLRFHYCLTYFQVNIHFFLGTEKVLLLLYFYWYLVYFMYSDLCGPRFRVMLEVLDPLGFLLSIIQSHLHLALHSQRISW
jgi:hypothetical protein